jgi:type II secretory pathway pseudopilin PulG
MRTRGLYRRTRAIASEENGTSLIEMVVAVMLMAIAASIYLGALTSVYSGVNRQQRRSEINDEARLAIEAMDREVRSGNILFDPTESYSAPTCGSYACVSGFSVRVYTQANATTRTPPVQCVQWLIQGRNLMRRSWAPGGGSSLSGWRIVATDIVNRDVSPTVPAFVRDSTGRTLNVTLLVNNRFGQVEAPRTVRIESSMTIRNYGTGDPCSPIPTT